MNGYIDAVLNTDSSLPPWLFVVAWVALYVATQVVMRATQAQLDSQQHLVVSNDEVIGRTLKPKYVLAQVVFASIVFAISITFGGAFFMFFAGGFVVATALAFGFNYHGLMYVRALHDDRNADGRLSLSVKFVLLTPVTRSWVAR